MANCLRLNKLRARKGHVIDSYLINLKFLGRLVQQSSREEVRGAWVFQKNSQVFQVFILVANHSQTEWF